MSKVKDNSLVKKFAKGFPVTVERGGDPANKREVEKLHDAEKQSEAENVASRLAEAARNR